MREKDLALVALASSFLLPWESEPWPPSPLLFELRLLGPSFLVPWFPRLQVGSTCSSLLVLFEEVNE